MNPPHGRPRSHFALSPRHERSVIVVSVLLALSGVLWLVSHYLLGTPDEFGAMRHPFETGWLRIHGGAAMAFLIVIGTVIPVHARRAWHARLNYQSGITVLSVALVLTLSGYGLYYAGSETARPWISLVHWVIGLVGVPTLVLHAILGRRTAARRHAALHRRHPRP